MKKDWAGMLNPRRARPPSTILTRSFVMSFSCEMSFGHFNKFQIPTLCMPDSRTVQIRSVWEFPNGCQNLEISFTGGPILEW